MKFYVIHSKKKGLKFDHSTTLTTHFGRRWQFSLQSLLILNYLWEFWLVILISTPPPPTSPPQNVKVSNLACMMYISKYLNCLISSIISELSVSPCEALVMNAMYIFSRSLLFWLLSKTKNQLCWLLTPWRFHFSMNLYMYLITTSISLPVYDARTAIPIIILFDKGFPL